jgi:hypothetical protein
VVDLISHVTRALTENNERIESLENRLGEICERADTLTEALSAKESSSEVLRVEAKRCGSSEKATTHARMMELKTLTDQPHTETWTARTETAKADE